MKILQNTCLDQQFCEFPQIAMNMARKTHDSCHQVHGICRCRKRLHFLWSWDHPSCWQAPANKDQFKARL